jgi:hypothetical protein
MLSDAANHRGSSAAAANNLKALLVSAKNQSPFAEGFLQVPLESR